jgi:hypothetical protein
VVKYFKGSDGPPTPVFWRDWTGQLVDFSSGWTFVVKVGTTDAVSTSFTKNTGITGAVGSLDAKPPVPNITIAWATSGELNSLSPGVYLVQIQATNVSDRFMQFLMEVAATLP